MIHVSASDTSLVEARTSRLSSSINRFHGALQESLTAATYLNSLIEPCRSLGLNIEAAAYFEAANAMWDQGEISSSIGMLQELEGLPNLKHQTIPIGRSMILAKLASQVSIAKLEKPDRIIEKYLSPALTELKGRAGGSEAGQVYHEFAVFCDRQYQDPDSIEDLERLRIMREIKQSEVDALMGMVKGSTGAQKQSYHKAYGHAKKWLDIDNEEYQRLTSGRSQLLCQSLENYLLSLAAWDDHDNDAMRFAALWLKHSDVDIASEAVSKHLVKVPTFKFASLANQLTSRLLDDVTDEFQKLLFKLVLDICIDHPYHGMYQVWAGQNTNPSDKDEAAVSRQKATSKVGRNLSQDPRSREAWSAIDRISKQYCFFAAERGGKHGAKMLVSSSPGGSGLNKVLSKYRLPPPTLQVELAVDKNYSRLPTMVSLEPHITIASGISAPKIITVIASNGRKYKQLVRHLFLIFALFNHAILTICR
jgi:ataxia telangiectasia mutated family protein